MVVSRYYPVQGLPTPSIPPRILRVKAFFHIKACFSSQNWVDICEYPCKRRTSWGKEQYGMFKGLKALKRGLGSCYTEISTWGEGWVCWGEMRQECKFSWFWKGGASLLCRGLYPEHNAIQRLDNSHLVYSIFLLLTTCINVYDPLYLFWHQFRHL